MDRGCFDVENQSIQVCIKRDTYLYDRRIRRRLPAPKISRAKQET